MAKYGLAVSFSRPSERRQEPTISDSTIELPFVQLNDYQAGYFEEVALDSARNLPFVNGLPSIVDCAEIAL
jgi:hypothetical protein